VEHALLLSVDGRGQLFRPPVVRSTAKVRTQALEGKTQRPERIVGWQTPPPACPVDQRCEQRCTGWAPGCQGSRRTGVR